MLSRTALAPLAVALAGLAVSGCASVAAPAWTPAAQQYTVVWSVPELTGASGTRFTDGALRRLKPGDALARVTCDADSRLQVGITRIVPDPFRETVEPLSISGALVCSQHSGTNVIALDGQATGLEDLLLVTPKGRVVDQSVTYSIEILQPITD